jgi:hypothetical protein
MDIVDALVLNIQERIGDTKGFLEEKAKGEFSLYNKMIEICKPELMKLCECLEERSKFYIQRCILKQEPNLFNLEPRVLDDNNRQPDSGGPKISDDKNKKPDFKKKRRPDYVEDTWVNFTAHYLPSTILKFKSNYGIRFTTFIRKPLEWECSDYLKKWRSSNLITLKTETGETEKQLDRVAYEGWECNDSNSVEGKYLLKSLAKESFDIINDIHTRVFNPNLLNKILIFHCRKLYDEKDLNSCISMLKELQNKPLKIVVYQIEQEYNTKHNIENNGYLFEKLISRIHTDGNDGIFLDGVDLNNKTIISEWIREIHDIINNAENEKKRRNLHLEYFEKYSSRR